MMLSGCGFIDRDYVPTTHSASAVVSAQYLAQYVCKEDGSPALFSKTNPCTPVPQTAKMKFKWRKFDIGQYQSEDSVQYGPGEFADVWLYSPFTTFNQTAGDGGELIADGKDNIPTYVATQDGSHPYMQYFLGYRCINATGWVIFSPLAPVGQSASTIAFLKDENEPYCSDSMGDWSLAYTQWQRFPSLPLTFNVFGVNTTINVDMIVSEHYNTGDVSSATDMELTGLVKWNGRTIWQDWKHGTGTPAAGVATRCPAISGLPTPGAGWYLYDCRYDVIIVSENGTTSVSDIGWIPSERPESQQAPD